MAPLRVGDCEFDPADGTLRSPDGVTRLEPKVQAVLRVLLDNRGSVVSKDRLFGEVWPETHVAPGALARTISVLRGALGDDAREPRYIETVPKRGYRFVAPVFTGAAAEAPPAVGHAESARRRSWARAALVAAAVAAAVTARHERTPPPMANGLFAHGFRYDTRIGNETAYEHYARALEHDPASADAHAGLAAVHVFRANYLPDRQRAVAAALASAEQAAKLDPSNVSAIVALGMAHVQAERLQEAERHYRRALALQPTDVVTAANLGRVQLTKGRVAEALALFEQYVAFQPRQSAGYTLLAAGLAVAGHADESAAAARAALAIEPYDLNAHLALVRLDLMAARHDAARFRLNRLLEGYTDCVQCVVQLGLIHQLQGDLQAAADRYRSAREMSARFAAASLRLAQVLRVGGGAPESDDLLTEVEQRAREALARGSESYGPRWQLAVAAAIRGDRRSALDWYEQAIASGRRDVGWDRWDPLLSSMQADGGFRALQSRAEIDRAAAWPDVQRIVRRLEVSRYP